MITGALIVVPYKVLPLKNAGHRGSVLYAEGLSKYVPVFLASTKDISKKHDYRFTSIPFFSTKVWWRYLNFFSFIPLLKITRQNNISHIIFEHPYLPIVFLLFRFLTSKTCIYHSHNIEFQRFATYKKWLALPLIICEILYHKFAHRIHSVSPDDVKFAIQKFRIKDQKIHYIPAAVFVNKVPVDSFFCKQKIRKLYALQDTEALLFFNGSLGYRPNSKALENIINNIIPALNNKQFRYKILICGGGLEERFLKFRNVSEIIYADYVEDIDVHNKGVDIMLNPVIEGGGVKVKLLDALAYNLPCVSTQSGARGLSVEVCGNKLIVVEDENWDAFADAIIELYPQASSNIPKCFYELYSIAAVGKKAFEFM